ncbi:MULTISPECIES: HD domain-containing protein [unclassified Rhizobium]|uniref:HD domain-containing protein n=1 Tax=unclassified Rhizobium TaxID=2613769 RepID=UPI001FF0524A|nr:MULTISPECIES: HD domain-containing protein [unclassified Rhizobium]NMN74325.1 Guanosine polyphosphate pyrophosphohydrolases/synthetases [Rhizobium sp. 57MFTsu3.2]
MASEHLGLMSEGDDGLDVLRAIKIAFSAHAGQTDKKGNPYFSHCKRVASAVEGDDQRIVAYLHDVVEKGRGWTFERLSDEGFNPSVVAAINALTRRENESEDEFVVRAVSDELARPVKVADLKDNLKQARNVGLDQSKYKEGLKIIEELYGVTARSGK